MLLQDAPHTCVPSMDVWQVQALKFGQEREPPHVPPAPQVGTQVHVATLYAWPVPQVGAVPL